MNALALLRATALAVAMACVAPSVSAASAPDPAVDAAGAWTDFLARGNFSDAWKAYDLLPELDYTYATVDPDKCRKHDKALQDALRKAPVAIALQRAAMLCAQAKGDDAGAEQAFQALAGLARHALRGMQEGEQGAPIRVLRQQDAYALVRAMGLEGRYEWFEQVHAARTFPLVIMAWDPDRKVERMLRFDWVDVAQRITREAASQYPYHRDEIADWQIRANAKSHDAASVDFLAWVDARATDAPRAKLDKLRMAVGTGGVQSAYVWLSICSRKDAAADCGDGFVDAVLPLAEKKHALPMVQLAYAYGEGVGVPRDAAVTTTLLDAADRRWSHRGASVRYAQMWLELHEEGTLPAAIVARLDRVASDNDDARVLLIKDRLRRDAKAPLADADIALLSSRRMNGAGQGYAWLAGLAKARKQDADVERFERLAAEAGSPDMQGTRAWRLLYSDGPRDKDAGVRLLHDAAQGGNAWSARALAARAADEGDFTAAEQWLLQPARKGDIDAVLTLAALYESGKPGLTGDTKRAIDIYRALAAEEPKARRRLAALAAEGKGMPKNVAEARRMLLADAERNDVQAQAELGLGLLMGTLGEVDEVEGVRWTERAIAGGETTTASSYGYWLYYRKGTPDSRVQALDVWRKALARGDEYVDNNLAWALCTAPFDTLRNPKEGLAIVEQMGPIVDLPVGTLDTAAACYAANGDFAQAQHAQREVIARMEAARAKSEVAMDDDAGEFRARLALYADGKPFFDSPERSN